MEKCVFVWMGTIGSMENARNVNKKKYTLPYFRDVFQNVE